jgi:hypothetical protein
MKQCVAYILRLELIPYFQSLRELFCQLLLPLRALPTIGGYFLNTQTVRMAEQTKERTILVHK